MPVSNMDLVQPWISEPLLVVVIDTGEWSIELVERAFHVGDTRACRKFL